VLLHIAWRDACGRAPGYAWQVRTGSTIGLAIGPTIKATPRFQSAGETMPDNFEECGAASAVNLIAAQQADGLTRARKAPR
jgi:hypothetical protein